MNRTLTIEDHVLGTAAKIREAKGLTMDDCDFIIAKDCNNWNAGSIFIRNSEWSHKFLDLWISMRFNTSIEFYYKWKEQASLIHILNNMPEFVGNHVTEIPQKIMVIIE